jgi:arsenate reductase
MKHDQPRVSLTALEANDVEKVAVDSVPSLGARRDGRSASEEAPPYGPRVRPGQPPRRGIGATQSCGRFRVTRSCCHTRLANRCSPDHRFVEVQVFGVKKNADTRKALRFFAERRVKTHFVDLTERAASLGELKRFAQKFGVTSLIDRDSKRYAELGLAHARYSDDRWLDKLVDEPLLIRIPLARFANRLTVGLAEAEWKAWVQG